MTFAANLTEDLLLHRGSERDFPKQYEICVVLGRDIAQQCS